MKNIIIILLSLFVLTACTNKKVAKDDSVFYTCSMDPQVISDRPGKCPICGMPLTLVKKSSVKNSDDIELSDQQIQLGNIAADTIRKGSLSNQLELTEEDTLPISDNLPNLGFIIPKEDLQKSLELKMLVKMVLQDGELEEREYNLCLEYTRQIGFNKSDLDDLIKHNRN